MWFSSTPYNTNGQIPGCQCLVHIYVCLHGLCSVFLGNVTIKYSAVKISMY